jgi:feruloyl-CoA synthase
VICLVGPTGVGKTTTVAKLAATCKLRHARRVGLITSDTYRIAAVEQLRTYAGIIGLPAPGCEVKLVPHEGKLEMRARGPNITPGYVREPELTAAAFDADGWYYTGDAGRLADPTDPRKGIVFDGRIAEDFKLTSGTWVNVGALRVAVLSAGAPLIQDLVVAGEGQAEIGLLIFPSLPGCRALAGEAARLDALVVDTTVRARLLAALERHNAEHAGSSRRIGRALLLVDPPALDAGEITDKGYINQRAVLRQRAALVARLYAEPPGDDVLVLAAPTAGPRASSERP